MVATLTIYKTYYLRHTLPYIYFIYNLVDYIKQVNVQHVQSYHLYVSYVKQEYSLIVENACLYKPQLLLSKTIDLLNLYKIVICSIYIYGFLDKLIYLSYTLSLSYINTGLFATSIYILY